MRSASLTQVNHERWSLGTLSGPRQEILGRISAETNGRCKTVDNAVKQRWVQEQQFLRMARDTPDDTFLSGGLGALALNPTVRIAVLPGDPSCQSVSAGEPKTVIPQFIKLPRSRQLPYSGTTRGTASGYVGYTPAEGGKWRSFCAVNWHGGVHSFLGDEDANRDNPLERHFLSGESRRRRSVNAELLAPQRNDCRENIQRLGKGWRRGSYLGLDGRDQAPAHLLAELQVHVPVPL